MKPVLITLTFVFTLGWLAQSAPVKIVLPLEISVLRKGPGVELAATNCLTCHSADYINMQPALTRTAWKANVDKMRGKFGAPIPEDQIDKLAAYLAIAYGKPEPVK